MRRNAASSRGTLISLLAAGLPACTGCLSWLMPFNVETAPAPVRSTVLAGPRAALQTEDGLDAQRLEEKDLVDTNLDEVFWLEIERAVRPGTVGGYISSPDAHNGALVLMFDGAATIYARGEVGVAISFYDVFGNDFRDAGFMTWCVVLPEFSTPYGQEDLADALEVVDWLDDGGREFLGVERVYVVGYSSGATVANLLNLHREVTAIVSMAGLTQPDQLLDGYAFYGFLAGMFAHNAGFGQLRQTLSDFRPGSDVRSQLDVVSRIEEFRSPMLFVHDMLDFIYLIDNTRAVETRYRGLLAEGVTGLPELEFQYVPGATHFDLRTDPDIRARVIEYLMRFEPGAGGG